MIVDGEHLTPGFVARCAVLVLRGYRHKNGRGPTGLEQSLQIFVRSADLGANVPTLQQLVNG
jgi:hypothetical protein